MQIDFVALLLLSIVYLIALLAVNISLYIPFKRRKTAAEEQKSVIPLFKPPTGLTPAICRILINRKIDEESVVDTLLELDRRGVIEIDLESKDFLITLNRAKLIEVDLWPHEAELLAVLFESSDQVSIGKNKHLFGRAIKTMARQLYSDVGIFFQRQSFSIYFWMFAGLAIAVVIVGIGASTPESDLFSSGVRPEQHVIALIGTLIAIQAFGLIIPIIINKIRYAGITCTLFGLYLGCQLMPIICMCVMFPLSFQLIVLSSPVSTSVLLGYLIYVGTLVAWQNEYSKLLTPVGLSYYREALGYKMYLKGAMRAQLEQQKELPKEIKENEDYIAYALALDVDPGWYKQFSNRHKRLFNYVKGNLKEFFDTLN